MSEPPPVTPDILATFREQAEFHVRQHFRFSRRKQAWLASLEHCWLKTQGKNSKGNSKQEPLSPKQRNLLAPLRRWEWDGRDMLQDVLLALLTAWRNGNYDPERGSVATFASTVAANSIKDILKARAAEKRDDRNLARLDQHGFFCTGDRSIAGAVPKLHRTQSSAKTWNDLAEDAHEWRTEQADDLFFKDEDSEPTTRKRQQAARPSLNGKPHLPRHCLSCIKDRLPEIPRLLDATDRELFKLLMQVDTIAELSRRMKGTPESTLRSRIARVREQIPVCNIAAAVIKSR